VTLPGFQQDREVRGQSEKKCLTAGCGDKMVPREGSESSRAHNQSLVPVGSRQLLSEEEQRHRAEERGTWRADSGPCGHQSLKGSSKENLKRNRVSARFTRSHPLDNGHFKVGNCLHSHRIWNERNLH